jgi:hypothetical protein
MTTACISVTRSGWAWGGACFGFAAAIKIWAFAPALLAGLTAGTGRARHGRVWFAAGFVAGLAVPCLPFLVLAPSGFARARYVWLETGSQGQIPWTHGLYEYFSNHFRLIGLASIHPGSKNVPRGGLYIQRQEYPQGAKPPHDSSPHSRPA